MNIHRIRNVIVADDTRINQSIMRVVLERHGLNPVIVSSGEALLDQLESDHRVDAIIIDLYMPELSGVEIIKFIRFLEQGKAPRLPIVAISADDSEATRLEAIDCGADAFIPRPVSCQKLISLVNELISTNLRQMDLENDPFSPSIRYKIDTTMIEALYQIGGAEFVSEIASIFSEESQVFLNYMRLALKEGDLTAFVTHMMNLHSCSAQITKSLKPLYLNIKSDLYSGDFRILGVIIVRRLERATQDVLEVIEKYLEGHLVAKLSYSHLS